MKLHEWQAEKKRKEEEKGWVRLGPCLNCGKQVEAGYYGHFEGGGVCSKKCNTAQEAKPKYPPPKE